MPGFKKSKVCHTIEEVLELWISDERIDEVDDCWLSKASCKENKYPKVSFKGKMHTLGRLVLTYLYGPPAEGEEMCHSTGCVSRKCVNPNHLRWDTRSKNHIDKSRMGNHPTRKLTDEQVIEIRARYEHGGTSHRKLAKEYGVCRDTIYEILSGKNFQYLLPTQAEA